MILLNIPKDILMRMYISTARRILCLTWMIIISLNKSAKAIIFISLPAAALLKIRVLVANLPKFFMIKASGMNWIYGARNGHMTGIPGGPCCLITWDQNSNLLQCIRDKKNSSLMY